MDRTARLGFMFALLALLTLLTFKGSKVPSTTIGHVEAHPTSKLAFASAFAALVAPLPGHSKSRLRARLFLGRYQHEDSLLNH